jgi:hypothetical protein
MGQGAPRSARYVTNLSISPSLPLLAFPRRNVMHAADVREVTSAQPVRCRPYATLPTLIRGGAIRARQRPGSACVT